MLAARFMHVVFSGSEPIDVFWIHNNREVTPQDTECQLIRDGNIHKLVIPQVCQQDVGEYVCEAYSDYGDTDTFCRLNVRGRNDMKTVISIEVTRD